MAQQDLWYAPFLSASIGQFRTLTNTKSLTLWFPFIDPLMCDYYLEVYDMIETNNNNNKIKACTHAKQLLFHKFTYPTLSTDWNINILLIIVMIFFFAYLNAVEINIFTFPFFFPSFLPCLCLSFSLFLFPSFFLYFFSFCCRCTYSISKFLYWSKSWFSWNSEWALPHQLYDWPI